MFKSTISLAIVFVSVTSVAFADGDDLFSSVRTKSVFESSPGPSSATNPANLLAKRITKAAELRELLKSAGFDGKVAGSRSAAAQKDLNPWEFPVLAAISEDEDHITIMLGLQTIEDSSQLSADTLLKMMQVNQQEAPAVFGYSKIRKRTELYCVLRNNGVTGRILRDEINRMATVAKRHEAIWDHSEAPSTTQQQAPTTPPAEKTLVANATSLVGKWSAARSATEAFAIAFSADGQFNLVFVNNGKQTKSSGNFAIVSGVLTMTGTDGMKLFGTIKMTSATTFTFTPDKTKALAFTKA
ncbi:hypothetical protein [Fuerstiella marisgermanici]|uniref:Uncharacterized protein n=1 Tax=Fuerstiella marisgermanici TaxID=1891926 RepID=A0A1P8WLY3_9PLAN|nr:hypothetical protein [Fuerstiella marisgermanici]APZ95060.1 hypothetical protein Fuma_04712 [Fuerstiella marisgermanici]